MVTADTKPYKSEADSVWEQEIVTKLPVFCAALLQNVV